MENNKKIYFNRFTKNFNSAQVISNNTKKSIHQTRREDNNRADKDSQESATHYPRDRRPTSIASSSNKSIQSNKKTSKKDSR